MARDESKRKVARSEERIGFDVIFGGDALCGSHAPCAIVNFPLRKSHVKVVSAQNSFESYRTIRQTSNLAGFDAPTTSGIAAATMSDPIIPRA